MTTTDLFHKHLDECERCRTKPFNLCAHGAWLLERAAADVNTKTPKDDR